jgi:hypothetical protein
LHEGVAAELIGGGPADRVTSRALGGMTSACRRTS